MSTLVKGICIFCGRNCYVWDNDVAYCRTRGSCTRKARKIKRAAVAKANEIRRKEGEPALYGQTLLKQLGEGARKDVSQVALAKVAYVAPLVSRDNGGHVSRGQSAGIDYHSEPADKVRQSVECPTCRAAPGNYCDGSSRSYYYSHT